MNYNKQVDYLINNVDYNLDDFTLEFIKRKLESNIDKDIYISILSIYNYSIENNLIISDKTNNRISFNNDIELLIKMDINNNFNCIDCENIIECENCINLINSCFCYECENSIDLNDCDSVRNSSKVFNGSNLYNCHNCTNLAKDSNKKNVNGILKKF